MSPHGRVEAALVLSDLLSLGIPPAAVAPCALTVSASAAVAGVALAAVSAGLGLARAARRRHGPAPRAWSTSSLGSGGDTSASERPEAAAISPGRLHAPNLRFATLTADARHVRRFNRRCSEAADRARLAHVCDLFVGRQPAGRSALYRSDARRPLFAAGLAHSTCPPPT